MSAQNFKTVYFSDFPAEDTQRRNLKVAFGTKDLNAYQALRPFSSCEVRALLGHESYSELRRSAEGDGLPINTYCLRAIRRWFGAREGDRAQYALPLLQDAVQHGTFRAAKGTAIHRWFPFLEGYSSHFVEQTLAQFAPDALRVLDPFGGVGTTPLAVAKLGREAVYCEINPLLQFLSEAKIRAHLLTDRERRAVVAGLTVLAERLPRVLASTTSDAALERSYRDSFGTSDFFPRRTFQEVLKARSLLDALACQDVLVAQFATVAVLASLVPASNLIRAGDLRFRRDNELGQTQDFISLCQNQLQNVAEDLGVAELIRTRPVFATADAKNLDRLPALEIDAVVTSPPYLNGTNYFRNTKVELWFLRSVRSTQDLTAFRSLSVTSGICDVSRQKLVTANTAVQRVVHALDGSAYDRRIPRMVGNYFHDMERVFTGLAKHLVKGATVAVDIGDSVYAGVHVPTDQLLVDIVAPLGFALSRTVPLRTRISRDSSPLRQLLVVLEYDGAANPSIRRRLTPTPTRPWGEGWARFKRDLPHQQQPFAKRNWGHPLHSLCSYQGKMKPALAHYLVRIFAQEGGRILDPFAGVGTIPFEAALQGVKAFGFEISPAAIAIAGAKVGRVDVAETRRVLGGLSKALESQKPSESDRRRANEVRFNGGMEDYFHSKTLREILVARRYFLERPPVSAAERLVVACILHILHGNRPYALSRRSHPITPFRPSGELAYRPLLPRLEEKLARSLAAQMPSQFVEGVVLDCDATSWWPQEVDQLDAIITSPPFFDSTRFYLANWMRLWFAGWERADFDSRPRAFVDERQKQSFRVYDAVFRQARERLKAEGVVVLHLGKSPKCDMATEIQRIAAPWFRVVDRFSESVAHCESHGIRDKGTVSDHQFLVLQ